MLKIKLGEASYDLDIDEALKSLTGSESILVEEYLGGWDKFRSDTTLTKSTIVIVWLAKRASGETATFDEIAEMPGLLFGGVLDVEDDGEGDFVEPDKVGDLPLATTNGSRTGTAGRTDSELGPEASVTTGSPLSAGSTG